MLCSVKTICCSEDPVSGFFPVSMIVAKEIVLTHYYVKFSPHFR